MSNSFFQPSTSFAESIQKQQQQQQQQYQNNTQIQQPTNSYKASSRPASAFMFHATSGRTGYDPLFTGSNVISASTANTFHVSSKPLFGGMFHPTSGRTGYDPLFTTSSIVPSSSSSSSSSPFTFNNTNNNKNKNNIYQQQPTYASVATNTNMNITPCSHDSYNTFVSNRPTVLNTTTASTVDEHSDFIWCDLCLTKITSLPWFKCITCARVDVCSSCFEKKVYMQESMWQQTKQEHSHHIHHALMVISAREHLNQHAAFVRT